MEAATLMEFGGGLVLFAWLFTRLIPAMLRESVQQDVFRIRNDLFVFMAEHGFDFDDEAYEWPKYLDTPRKRVMFLLDQWEKEQTNA